MNNQRYAFCLLVVIGFLALVAPSHIFAVPQDNPTTPSTSQPESHPLQNHSILLPITIGYPIPVVLRWSESMGDPLNPSTFCTLYVDVTNRSSEPVYHVWVRGGLEVDFDIIAPGETKSTDEEYYAPGGCFRQDPYIAHWSTTPNPTPTQIPTVTATPTNTPTSTPGPSPTPEPHIAILSEELGVDSNTIVGEVENRTYDTVAAVDLEGYFSQCDRGGCDEETTQGQMLLSGLAVGDKTCYVVPSASIFWDSYSISVTSFSPFAGTPYRLSVVSSQGTASASGYTVTGELRNDETHHLINVEAIVTFYGSSGTVCDCVKAPIDTLVLAEGQTSPFTVTSACPEVTTYRVQVHGEY